MSESRDTSHPNSAPTPSPETQRLGALVGRWRSEGHIVGDPAVLITGPTATSGSPVASSSSTASTS
jgi:hypothetical protein